MKTAEQHFKVFEQNAADVTAQSQGIDSNRRRTCVKVSKAAMFVFYITSYIEFGCRTLRGIYWASYVHEAIEREGRNISSALAKIVPCG